MITIKMSAKGDLERIEGTQDSNESIIVKYASTRGRVAKIFIGKEIKDDCALTIEYSKIHSDITKITPGPAANKVIMHIGSLIIKN